MAIDAILSIQNDDAFENEWQVIIPPFPGIIDPVGLNIRAVKVETPTIAYERYKVHYKTEHAEKPAGKQSTDKILKISFRIDKNYIAYKSLLNWCRLVHDPQLGTASRDYMGGVPLLRVPITIMYLDANGLPTTTPEVYNNCLITDIPNRSYTYESGNPIIMDFSFIFTSMIPMV